MKTEFVDEQQGDRLTAVQQEALDRCEEAGYLDYDLGAKVDFDLQSSWLDYCLEARLPLIYLVAEEFEIEVNLSWTLCRFDEKLEKAVRERVLEHNGTVSFIYDEDVAVIKHFQRNDGVVLASKLTKLVNKYEYAALRKYCFGDREEWPGYRGIGFE